jgi:hypothetical protein
MGPISIHDLARVVDYLEEINDPRRTEYGRLKQDFLKGFLELPNGIPDESAFRRVLQCLNPKELREGLENWLVDVKLSRKEEGAGVRLVNIDGKTIRGAGFMW